MKYQREQKERKFIEKDDYAYVLDFRTTQIKERMFKIVQISQVIGEKSFSLLEVVPRKGITLTIGERVYIGEGKRDKIDHILRKISYNELTNTSKDNLIEIIEKIVIANEKTYVNFFNTAHLITPRLHVIETIPRIGKTFARQIIEEREIKPFESFKDMEKRIKNFGNPARHIAEKIVEELKGESKYYLFVQKENSIKIK